MSFGKSGHVGFWKAEIKMQALAARMGKALKKNDGRLSHPLSSDL
jgi:hypothetical protein